MVSEPRMLRRAGALQVRQRCCTRARRAERPCGARRGLLPTNERPNEPACWHEKLFLKHFHKLAGFEEDKPCQLVEHFITEQTNLNTVPRVLSTTAEFPVSFMPIGINVSFMLKRSSNCKYGSVVPRGAAQDRAGPVGGGVLVGGNAFAGLPSLVARTNGPQICELKNPSETAPNFGSTQQII